MQDVVKLVSAELRGAWRYRWHALGAAWAVCVVGWLAVYFTPDKYEASSRFYVDTSSALRHSCATCPSRWMWTSRSPS